MTRKEMIVVAAIVNAGLLAVLFMTAGDLDNPKMIREPSLNDSQQRVIAESEGTHDEKGLPPPIITIPLFEERGQLAALDLPTPPPIQEKNESLAEVKVKRGDVLEKIARANGTTVEAIKQANGLKNERIAVGQVLKIPVGTVVKNDPKEPVKESSPDEAVYYTIKGGDNPWKLAKQLHISSDELLRLNNLNEEKARNLKVGDKIRVK